MNHKWLQAEPEMAASGEKVLHLLEAAGFRAYFVGGCVRDELMGLSVHDMDIATSAEPDKVMELFERTVPTGLAHGTVTVLLEGQSFEVTTFRKETGYTDHRRPSEVQFVSGIEEDLQRRDFTMNAMARDIHGELVDPYGGAKDIRRGWIRCVGKAEERFEEDALRMLRAVRFASVFGFKPLKSLWRALLSSRDSMAYIATERIRAELERIILGPHPQRGLALLARSRLLAAAAAPLPPGWADIDGGGERSPGRPRRAGRIQPAAAGNTAADSGIAESSGAGAGRSGFAYARAAEMLAAMPVLPVDEPALRWSLLLSCLGVKPEEAGPLLRSWTFSGALTRQIAALLQIDEAMNPPGGRPETDGETDSAEMRRVWTRLQISFGKETAGLWLLREKLLTSHFKERITNQGEAAGQGKPDVLEHRISLIHKASNWHTEIKVHSAVDLAITAAEIMAMSGKRGGPWLGQLQKELVELTADGELQNERQVLLEVVKERLKHD